MLTSLRLMSDYTPDKSGNVGVTSVISMPQRRRSCIEDAATQSSRQVGRRPTAGFACIFADL